MKKIITISAAFMLSNTLFAAPFNYSITPSSAWVRIAESEETVNPGHDLSPGEYNLIASELYYLDQSFTIDMPYQGEELAIVLALNVDEVKTKLQSRRSLVNWLRDLADENNPQANRILADLYNEGEMLGKNLGTALMHYSQAAEAGDAYSMRMLAHWYEQGIYVKQNMITAAEWLERAARNDDAQAQYLLGQFFLEKLKGQQNYAEAIKWFKRAAWLDHQDSLAVLVNMYNEGIGVDQNDPEKIFWYERLAATGDASTMRIVAEYYRNNNELAKWFDWIKKLARTNDPESMLALALAYRDGLGTDKDKNLAIEWLQKAQKSGSKDAAELLAELNPPKTGTKPAAKPVAKKTNLPNMITIEAGHFQMGNDERGTVTSPSRRVLVQSFMLSSSEVTWDQFAVYAKELGVVLPKDNGWGRGSRPVINVSWHQAVAYTRWLSEKTGDVYRLPTEAEWEYAARAGTTTDYYWGPTFIRYKANCIRSLCDDKYSFTSPVASFDANPWGLHDMLGNVWEWTLDCWNPTFINAPKDGSAWLEGVCNAKVVKGGSWMDTQNEFHIAARREQAFNKTSAGIGFRVVKELPTP